MILNGIHQRDYPVVQGGVLFVAVAFVLVNLAVDVLYAWLDPRIRYE
jgi:peptide/nickel transport system permease protein